MNTRKTLGELIKQKVKEANLTAEEFAEAIHSNRSSVFSKIYKCDCDSNIDVGLLMRISRCLNFNFFEEMSRCINESEIPQKYIVLLEANEKTSQEFIKACQEFIETGVQIKILSV
ncbi:MAG: hypothetical protein LBR55_01795 [Bacteroidales bacterium]|jgi:transcriptional regulator with XRE-family HTH domain|nr:hypothetical protein [Bacteroidales bacterium]